MTHEYLHHTPLPDMDLLFDGMTYDLGWNGSRTNDPTLTIPALPTVDHAIYLVNAVKFHCGQIYHLFDDESFMKSLYHFYEEPPGRKPDDEMWYVHFLVIIAFGKAFTTKKNQGRCPPGAEFFIKALHLLPDMIMLWQDPVHATEIFCCIALYLQCAHYRLVAHNFVRYPQPHIGSPVKP